VIAFAVVLATVAMVVALVALWFALTGRRTTPTSGRTRPTERLMAGAMSTTVDTGLPFEGFVGGSSGISILFADLSAGEQMAVDQLRAEGEDGEADRLEAVLRAR
jgi:hypothetical protein